MRAWYAFRYWLTVYARTWRGTVVIAAPNSCTAAASLKAPGSP